MRIYKNDIIKASAISTGADRGVLLCSITDSGFPSIAGVISAVKDKLPGKDHKKMIFEIRNDCGDDAFVLNTKRGKGMQSTYRREKIVRTEKEFDINGTKVMAYSRKDAIKRLKHKKWKTDFMLMLVFSFLLKGAPACEGMPGVRRGKRP